MADIEDLDRFRTLPLPKAVEDIRLKAMDNDDRHFTKALLKDLIKKSGTAGDIWRCWRQTTKRKSDPAIAAQMANFHRLEARRKSGTGRRGEATISAASSV